MRLSRRDFVAAALGMASASALGCRERASVPGEFVGEGAGPPGDRPGPGGALPAGTGRVSVVIVGAGLAGLSAAWWLERQGFDDLVVLEADRRPGGDARWGTSAGLRHPWGGRHLPIPPDDAVVLRELLADLGVLRDGVWDETARVRAPAHRLFRWGRWRPGLVESLFETGEEREGWRIFRERAAAAVGPSGGAWLPWPDGDGGEPPGAASELDGVTMVSWLSADGAPVPASLRWLVEHLCRDDFGVGASAVSARAGLAATVRRGPEAPGLSWPEGTGWIARRLAERLDDRLLTGTPVVRVTRAGTGATVETPTGRLRAEAVVWAAPVSAAVGVVADVPAPGLARSHWVTANLTLHRRPESKGAPRAWHNVRFGSRSTGYVPADHQLLGAREAASVWTWYRPLDDLDPDRARSLLLRRSRRAWVEEILTDLGAAHPDIRRCVSRIDVLRMPGATLRPAPGLLGSRALTGLRRREGPVVFGHSDLSGLPYLRGAVEEGVRAARAVLRRIGVAPGR